jgi:hypothetical protein
VAGTALFAACSLAGGLAANASMLVGARLGQRATGTRSDAATVADSQQRPRPIAPRSYGKQRLGASP